MPLCKTCGNIDFVKISQSTPKAVFVPTEGFPAGHGLFFHILDDDIRTSEGVVLYHKTVEDLMASAQLCDLCRLVMSAVEKVLENMKKAREANFKYDLTDHQLWICGTCRRDGVQILSINSNDWNRPYVLCGIRFCVDEDSVFNHIIHGRTHHISPTDPSAMRKISRWLVGASEQDGCAPSPGRLPTRLLEIKDEGAKVTLVITSNQTAKYAALSHCWGPVRPMTLTKDSLSLLKGGVETSSLPQSFQDAIWLAHRLGVQYLWIDSLCILQDDLQDWVHESARMRDVYENSWVTIAASRASCSAEGFLGDQDHYEYVSIPYQKGVLSEEILAFTVPIDHAADSSQRVYLNDEPLTTRGWALQERFISRRTLHFGRSQILLEHRGLVFTQDSCTPVPLPSYNPIPGSNRYLWYSVVEQFSTRKLTKERDKLPALAALAAYFTVNLSDGKDSVYLAGIWREDMLEGLCWELDSHSSPGTRPQPYRAPSWSWPAIDGRIRFGSLPISAYKLAIVENAHTSPVSLESPFGEVQGGWVRLRAMLLRPIAKDEITHERGPFWFSEDKTDFYICAQWDAEPQHVPARGEAADIAKGETDLQFIPMYCNNTEALNPNAIVGPFCLIVKQAKHAVAEHSDLKGFQRVGTGLAIPNHPNGRDGLMKLAAGKWTEMMLAGQLEDIVVLDL